MVSIDIYGFSGKKQESLSLDVDLEKKDLNKNLFSQSIFVLLQNWRQGTVGCKARGDVDFSTKKPWKQKGTGRARAGSARSPLWRSGGVTFGPQLRDRLLLINKKQTKRVLGNLFFDKLEQTSVYCLDQDICKNDIPRTKEFVNILKNMNLFFKKVLIFLPFDDHVIYSSCRNISNVNIVFFDQPNVFDLVNADCWLFFKKDIVLFKEMIKRWN